MTRSNEHSAGDQSPGTGYLVVVGLGYVGLPLAATLAATGSRVVGVDLDPRVLAAVQAGRPLVDEPGLDELLASLPEGRLTVADRIPRRTPDGVIVCVGTPVETATGRPDLRFLRAAVDELAEVVDEHTVVIIRSTVAVGTCRGVVLPRLSERTPRPKLAFCPERIIQGRALEELRGLPQIVGGLDRASATAAADLLAPVTPRQVLVSGLETAELIKLVCNANTDLIYGFGNEIAAIAEGLGVDADEVIAAANLDYPRPDICRPGFVGGSCLVKDPHMLIGVAAGIGYDAPMVRAARAVNEQLPYRVLRRVVAALAARGRTLAETTVLLCGVAYKGRPPTDDTRGSAATVIATELAGLAGRLIAHDFLVGPDRLAAMGLEPTELADGLRKADVVLLLTDNPGYDGCDVAGAVASAAVVFDMWGLWQDRLAGVAGVEYLRLGRG